eukprot:3565604-Rhodomonas_salina.1
MRPYLSRASQTICNTFVDTKIYNEVTNRWAAQPAWGELAAQLRAQAMQRPLPGASSLFGLPLSRSRCQDAQEPH